MALKRKEKVENMEIELICFITRKSLFVKESIRYLMF